jgi:hypothetical protein
MWRVIDMLWMRGATTHSISRRDEAKTREGEFFWDVMWNSSLYSFLYYLAAIISTLLAWGWLRAELQGRICGQFEVPNAARGRTYCITGGSRGIGFEAARLLLLAGAKVVLGVRDVKGTQAKLRAVIRDEKILQNAEVRSRLSPLRVRVTQA